MGWIDCNVGDIKMYEDIINLIPYNNLTSGMLITTLIVLKEYPNYRLAEGDEIYRYNRIKDYTDDLGYACRLHYTVDRSSYIIGFDPYISEQKPSTLLGLENSGKINIELFKDKYLTINQNN